MSVYSIKRSFPSSSSAFLTAVSQIGYVYQVALSSDKLKLFISTQDRAIRRIDLENFSLAGSVSSNSPAHDSTITDIQAVPATAPGCSSGEVLVSTSNDGSCKFWDMRESGFLPIVTIRLSNNWVDAPTFGSTVNDRGVCASACGSEISLFEFGHWRKYFTYSESHFDQINCLRYAANGSLISGGEDGLVNFYNVYDLNNEDEGQCPVLTLNTENSVRSVRDVSRSAGPCVYVFSGTECVSLWDTTVGSKFCHNDTIRSHPIIAGSAQAPGEEMNEDSMYCGSSQQLGYLIGVNERSGHVLAGNNGGAIAEFDPTTSEVVAQFNGSHNGVVRSAVYLGNTDRIVTAGEDGLIIEWGQGRTVFEVDLSLSHNHRSVRSPNPSRPY